MDALAEKKLHQCEIIMEQSLRSPSTLKVISKEKVLSNGKGNDYFTIVYDAANAFGTPVRNTIICKYKPQSEHPEIEADLEAVVIGNHTLSEDELISARLNVAVIQAGELISKIKNH